MDIYSNNESCDQNCSLEDFKFDSPVNLFPIPVLIGITVICILLSLIGITGNIMTILIVLKYRDMRTTINFYLSSMALSDLMIFLSMPFDLYRIWQYRPWNFGVALCKMFQFISESCTYSTILNITALSVERYLAICFPLKAKVVITKGRVKGIILFLWTVAFLCAGPIFVLVGVEHMNGTDPLETNECKATEYAVRSGLLYIMVLVSSIYFFLPVFCLSILYSLIGRKLWRRKQEAIGPNLNNRHKSNKQTVKMLAVVVFAFILCWLPFHVGRYLFSNSEAGSQISQYCSLVSMVLFYLSAAINPILYNIMSKKFRVAASKMFQIKKASGRKPSTVKEETSQTWTKTSIIT